MELYGKFFPWTAYGRYGLFGTVATDGTIVHGSRHVPLDALPPHVYAGIVDEDPDVRKPPLGIGQRLIFDVGGDHEQAVVIQDLLVAPAKTLVLKDPLVILDGSGDPDEITDPVNIGIAKSPALFMGTMPKKVAVTVLLHGLKNERGADANTNPKITFKLLQANEREGPYEDIAATLDFTLTKPTGDSHVPSETKVVTLQPKPWLIATAVTAGGDGGDTLFSLQIMRSADQV